MNYVTELPFNGLSDIEFMKVTGSWVHHSIRILTDSRDLFNSVIESPDKADDLNLNTIESKYYISFQKASSKGFSIIFHCDICSLPKNLTLLNNILITVKELPSIIAVTENKLVENNPYNISIPGYNF